MCVCPYIPAACNGLGGRSPGSKTPGDPATPSPPLWRGSTLALCLCTGPYQLELSRTCSTSEHLHNRGIDHVQTATADLHSFLTSEPNGTAVAQRQAVNILVQERKRATTVGSRLSSHRLHRECAGPVQERHRTLRQWRRFKVPSGVEQIRYGFKREHDEKGGSDAYAWVKEVTQESLPCFFVLNWVHLDLWCVLLYRVASLFHFAALCL